MLKVPLKCVTQWMDWSYRWKAAFDSDCDDSELVALLDGFYEVMYQARAEFAVVGFDSRGMDNLCINYSHEQSLEWKFAVMREAVIILQEFYRATTSGEFAGQYVHRYDDDKICSEFRERIAWYKSELEKAKAEAPAPLVDAEPSSPLSEDGRTITWGGRDFVLAQRMSAQLGQVAGGLGIGGLLNAARNWDAVKVTNQTMEEKLQAEPERIGWTAQDWANELGRGKLTILKTETWAEIKRRRAANKEARVSKAVSKKTGK